MIPLIPSTWLSAAAISACVLFIAGWAKTPQMTRSSLVLMMRIGQIWMGSMMFLYGTIYYFAQNITLEERMVYVRIVLFAMSITACIWQGILLKWGKTL